MPKSFVSGAGRKGSKKKRGVNARVRGGKSSRPQKMIVMRDSRKTPPAAGVGSVNYIQGPGRMSNRSAVIGVAPYHDGMRSEGHRMKFSVRVSSAIRSAGYAFYMFKASDGTTEVAGIWTNPLTKINMYQPDPRANAYDYTTSMWGATPLAAMIKLYTRLAVRKMKVIFVPSAGASEIGNAAIVCRPDVDHNSTSLFTYDQITATEGCKIFSLNRRMSYTAIDDDLRKPATRLDYIDPANSSEFTLLSSFVVWAATDDVQATASKIMGDWWIEGVVDLYNLQGNTAPATRTVVLERYPDGKKVSAEDAKVVRAINAGERPYYVPLDFAASSQSQSTSSVSAAVAPSAASVAPVLLRREDAHAVAVRDEKRDLEPKEAKEAKDGRYSEAPNVLPEGWVAIRAAPPKQKS